ncbi:hypothetical protein DLAC_00259 [Tieghemostelium lacteum]|uniref:Uncharacterized protein n=1 Tax=Tieghemostelium lacteum TaxID=361077 RepID=A0A152A9A4_TIELA|nr:hypothetical protein DLAC_00259 [Tieghemostelium lacteum]|eukprot:KYR02794.1 hypothetical protein DLAC_00259 [Tieghemostelium lacteum]
MNRFTQIFKQEPEVLVLAFNTSFALGFGLRAFTLSMSNMKKEKHFEQPEHAKILKNHEITTDDLLEGKIKTILDFDTSHPLHPHTAKM